MNKYLREEILKVPIRDIDEKEIKMFKNEVRKEMINMGANKFQIMLIKDGSIKSAIINHRKPKDLAWAILQ